MADVRQNRTISFWFKTPTLHPTNAEVLYEEGGGSRGFSVHVQNGNVHVAGWNRNAGESNWNETILSSPIVPNQTYHLVMRLEDGPLLSTRPDAFTLWLQGQQVGSGDGGAVYKHSDDIGLGGMQGTTHNAITPTQAFTGWIDDFRLYNRALSAWEIRDLHHGRDIDAVDVHFPLDEGSGSVISDAQGNVPDVTLLPDLIWDDGLY